MDASIPHPAGLFSGRMMARTQLGSWATTHDPLAKAARVGRASLLLAATRNLVVATALAVIFTICLRAPIVAPVPADAAVFPPEPPLPSAGPGAPAPAAPVAATTPEPTAITPAPESAQPRTAPATAPASAEPAADTSAPAVADAAPAAPAIEADAPRTTGIRVMTTGYCPCRICCGAGAEGITSIRRDVHQHPRGIAVDPALIPYRTVLTVPGYGTAMADDTGAAMRHDGDAGVVHIDLRFRTHAQAKAWGVRWVDVDVPESSLAASLAKPASEAPAEASSYASGERN